jgi:hypothetical protein
MMVARTATLGIIYPPRERVIADLIYESPRSVQV